MATRLATACTYPGCPEIARRQGRCERHPRPTIRHRPKPNYGPGWQAIRAQVLREEPFCRECGAATNTVDHIVPIARGGTNARENLRAMCASCHSRKTAREDGRWGKGH